MSAESESGAEKTEEPTAKRKGKARSEGQVGSSKDFSMVFGMLGAVLAMHIVLPWMWQDFELVFRAALSMQANERLRSYEFLQERFQTICLLLMPDVLLIALTSAIFGAGSTAIQTKFLWSWKLLKPKFSQLNPISGLKRIFGTQNFLNLLKSLAKLAIIFPIAYNAFFRHFPGLLSLTDASRDYLLVFLAHAAYDIFWRVALLLLILGILDLIYQKWKTHRTLKMTKEEVKDERKAVEGDEATKRRIQAKALQRIRQRIMQTVPTADVVVTNPTHYAVALAYDADGGGAPRVVAKGKDHLALRIRAIAQESGVPVLERKTLARALYGSVEVGHAIPVELYAAVAELLAFVYRIQGKLPQLAARR